MPVDQRAGPVDVPAVLAHQPVTLFRREKKLARERVAEHQESLSHSAGCGEEEKWGFLPFSLRVRRVAPLRPGSYDAYDPLRPYDPGHS